MTAPIKTCDYCGATGEMPTFMDGETICYTCLHVLPKTLPEARQELMRLRAELAIAQPAPSVPMDVIADYLVSISAHLARRDDAKAQAEIGALLKMIAPAPKPAPSVPDGWKLVPIEPTQEMVDRVIDERLDALAAGKDHTFIDIYKAMLAAAPEAKPCP